MRCLHRNAHMFMIVCAHIQMYFFPFNRKMKSGHISIGVANKQFYQVRTRKQSNIATI